MKCCVPSCGLTSNNYGPIILDNVEEITFHEIPTIPWLRKSWLGTIGIRESFLPREAVVCSQHFQKYDFSETTSGVRKLRKNSVPSTFRVPSSKSPSLHFCLICLDTAASKLLPLNKNHLSRAYTNVVGLDMSDVCDLIAYPKLCPECAHRLIKCDTFKNKALKAHSILIQLLLKDKVITSQGLKSVNRVGNLLTSSIMKDAFKPDHYDLYVTHNEDDKNIPKKESIICNSNPHEKSNLKSKKNYKTKHDCKRSRTGNEKVYLSEPSDTNKNDDFKVTNNVINIDHKLHNRNIVSQVIIYEDKLNDYVNSTNPDKSNNDKNANDKSDVFIICDSDDEVKFGDKDDIIHDVDNNMKCHDIDDVSKRNMSDDIDDASKHNISDVIDHDIDEDIRRDISDDINHDIDDASKRNISDDIDDDVRCDVIDDIDHDIDDDIGRDMIEDINHDTDNNITHDMIDDIDHDIGDASKRNMNDDIDHDIDDGIEHEHNIDVGIAHDTDSDNIDIDIDVDPDNDELLNKNHSSDRLLNKLKTGYHSVNQNLEVNNGTKCKNETEAKQQ